MNAANSASPARQTASRAPRGPYWLLSPALLFYTLLLIVPIGMTALLSLYAFDDILGIQQQISFNNYLEVLTDPYFHKIFLRTLVMSVLVVLVCVALGVPEAYILNRMGSPWKGIFLLVILGPLLISVVVRTLGWAILFGREGLISESLQLLGLSDGPVSLMYSQTGVVIALVHVLVPFMVISVWASLQRLDPDTERAASSLCAKPWTIMRRVVMPQIMPGILSGSVIVFALAATAFATPAIIGGRRFKVVATTAYDEFLNTLNWPLGAAIAVILLLANVAIIASYNRYIERKYAQVFES
ncbi:ABC transporter permease [Marinobacterium arenosum]|uniref:ABC transporter permease n=1 Tax=Marinobacterium arenosum TaxID=2862496 RepID=UPI001C95FCB3|nr:ABC transporter permease [Marinobacterium arenosum]MBY4676174.1 ABC transporter permease [Marinobacterium arenosum]